jgi:hypothetical protein
MRDSLRVIDGGSEGSAEVRFRKPQGERRPCHRHTGFELDQSSRRVYCTDCEHEVDPFTAIEHVATMLDRLNQRYRAVNAEVRKASARLDDLKRQERNTKARVRRATTDAQEG